MQIKLVMDLLKIAGPVVGGALTLWSTSESEDKKIEMEKLKLQLEHSNNKSKINAGIITAVVGVAAPVIATIVTNKLNKNK